MARGRMITNEITRDKRINDLSDDTSRLAFTWLITFADSEGRTYGDPALVRSMLFPRRTDVTTEHMAAIIQEWHQMGLIVWYEAQGDRFIYFPKFEKHQIGLRKDREADSMIPPPPGLIPEPKREEPPNPGSDSGNDGDRTPAEVLTNSGETPEKIGLIKENLIKVNDNNGAGAPPLPSLGPFPKPPGETILPDTPGTRVLFALLLANAKVKQRPGPKQFPSLECKRKFLQEAEGRLSPEDLKKGVERALQKGICDISGCVDFASKWQKNTNGRGAEIPAEEI